MASSLVDRIRHALGVNNEHTAEHVEVRRELTEQRLRLRRLDAYVQARGIGQERRRTMSASHPNRRVTDA